MALLLLSRQLSLAREASNLYTRSPLSRLRAWLTVIVTSAIALHL
nr:MAG TPA: hypothetical protein [Caudoviricetes sp.]